MRRLSLLVTVLLAAGILGPPPAIAADGCQSRTCHERVAAKVRASCTSTACKRRAGRKARIRRERAEWRRYKANPLPWCTWGPESGVGNGEWSMVRYRMPAKGQGPHAGGGKFQIIDKTWRAFGGLRYAAHAQLARPIAQERVARKIMAGQGPGAWVNC